jgi:exodeoxyribonuclease-3
MLRVVTFNANGIRSAGRKGFFDWLAGQRADVVCIQETKAQLRQLKDPMFFPEGYHCHYVDAERAGYAGVALYTRREPQSLDTAMGCDEFDREGRYALADYGPLRVVSLYAPSGSAGPQRQASKDRFLECFPEVLDRLKAAGSTIVCGDFNIAHREIDLKNWRSNQKNSGFLPHERHWMECLFTRRGYVDAFRVVNQEPDQYTWWSNRGRAWEKNVGWRIDYHVVTADLAPRVLRAEIYKARRFSDHAPLILDYDLDL